jgi:hypothetical protein
MRALAALKNRVLPEGERPRTIVLGINRSCRMYLDLQHDTQRWLGMYEREIAPFLRRHSRRVSFAIDVGAADGFYTLYFLRHTSARRVIAVEPSKRQRERLVRNLNLNGLTEDKRLTIVRQPAGIAEGSVALDSVWGGQVPCVVKVDVDGPEVDVLAGSRGLLAADGVTWIVETHGPSLEEQCLDRFRLHGYQPTVVPNAPWRRILPEQRPIGHNRWIYAAR